MGCSSGQWLGKVMSDKALTCGQAKQKRTERRKLGSKTQECVVLPLTQGIKSTSYIITLYLVKCKCANIHT